MQVIDKRLEHAIQYCDISVTNDGTANPSHKLIYVRSTYAATGEGSTSGVFFMGTSCNWSSKEEVFAIVNQLILNHEKNAYFLQYPDVIWDIDRLLQEIDNDPEYADLISAHVLRTVKRIHESKTWPGSFYHSQVVHIGG